MFLVTWIRAKRMARSRGIKDRGPEYSFLDRLLSPIGSDMMGLERERYRHTCGEIIRRGVAPDGSCKFCPKCGIIDETMPAQQSPAVIRQTVH
jgi:hypothetical protein